MFEKILDILKAFFEKYFINTLIAIVPTIIIYYYTPDNFDFMKKIGKELYLLFLFVICFLIIEFLCYCYKFIKNKKYYNKLNRENSEQIEKQNLNYIWNYVDDLNDNEKKLLNYLLDNNNKILNIPGSLGFNHLYMEWFNSTEIVSDGTIKGFDIFKIKETDMIESGYIVTQYKLKDEIFEALQYSKNKYGRISNFQ